MQQNCVSSRREERSKRRILAQFLLHMQKLPQQQQVNQVGQHEYQHPRTYRTRPLLQPNRIRVFHNFQFSIKSLKTVFSRQRNGAGPLSAHLSYPLATIFARMLTIRFWPNSLETVTAHCACSNLPNFLPRSSSLIFREVLGTRYSRRDLFSIQLLWENVFLSQMKSTARGVMELCLAPKATDLAEELAP